MSRKTILSALLLALCSVAAQAADFNGKWHAKFPSPTGDRESTFEFHIDGSTPTCTVANAGGQEQENKKLTDCKIDGDDISFTEVMNENFRIEYQGKIDGDQIKFAKQLGDMGAVEMIANRVK